MKSKSWSMYENEDMTVDIVYVLKYLKIRYQPSFMRHLTNNAHAFVNVITDAFHNKGSPLYSVKSQLTSLESWLHHYKET
jgi:hypothetical protein